MLSVPLRPIASALAVALFAGAASGCATPGDIERLEGRIVALEQWREQRTKSMQQEMERLEKLHAMITEAEATLRKSGANLGIRVERVETELPRQRGELDATAHKLDRVAADIALIKKELADRLGSTAFFLPPDLPKDKDGVWARAEQAAQANDLREAQAIFELYEASFGDDARAPTALWEIARLMEKNGDTEEAIRFYQKVFDRHHASPLAPRAVKRIAEIYVIKGECRRAKEIYGFIASEYKGSPEANEAKRLAKNVLKECKK